jgi:hypothetical protein
MNMDFTSQESDNDINNVMNEMLTHKYISPIFLSNGKSSTVIIPIDLARKYDIDHPSHVTIEDTKKGILIKKLEIK